MSFNTKLNSSPEFLTLLLENSNEGIIACDMQFNIIFRNRRAIDIHGYPPDISPAQWNEYLTILDANGIDEVPFENLPIVRALKGEVVTDSYYLLKRKNKTSISVKYNARPLYDENNVQIGAIVTTEDNNNLIRSLARFKSVFDQSPLSIQVMDKSGKTLLVNKSYRNLWGITEEFVQEFIMKRYNMLEDELLIKSGAMETILKAFNGEAVQIKEFYYDPTSLGFPGRARWAGGIMYPLKDLFGDVQEVVIIHQDRTDEHNALEEKEKLLSQLEAILRQMPAGLMVSDSNGEILLQNELMKNILRDFGDAKDVFQKPIARAIKGEKITTTEVFSSNSGLKTIFKTKASPIAGADGKISGSILLANDVSLEKRIESNQIFLAQVNNLLISTIDYDQILERVAGSSIPYLADGCMVDLIEGDSIVRVVTKHKDPFIQGLMNELQRRYPPNIDSPQPTAKAIRSGTSQMMAIVDQEVIVKHCYDSNHAELITRIGIKSHIAIPLKIRGRTIGAINLFVSSDRPHFDDIDYTVALEIAKNASVAIDNASLYKDAKSGVQLRDDFISIASHELRTPITSLGLQIEVLNNLVNGLQGDTEIHQLIKKFLGSTNNQINRLARLVDDMLDITRITSGKMNHNPRKINFTSLTREVIDRFKDQLRSYQIESSIFCKEDIELNCDPEKMDQVITNFMTNAIRYGGKKPIHIIIEETQDRVILKIKDHGRGINKSDQERIFNRFERAHTADDVDGLGLGLYINNQIVKVHGGKILIDSEPGKGATFIVELPKIIAHPT